MVVIYRAMRFLPATPLDATGVFCDLEDVRDDTLKRLRDGAVLFGAGTVIVSESVCGHCISSYWRVPVKYCGFDNNGWIFMTFVI